MTAPCATCRFWESDYTIGTDPSPMGCCHRYAPKPNSLQFADADTTWPMTRSSDFCGEHEPTAIAPPAPVARAEEK